MTIEHTAELAPIREVLAFETAHTKNPADYQEMAERQELGDRVSSALTAPTVNVELLHQILDHIKTHPAEWEQARWRCGTSMCVAGHAVTLGGRTWASPEQAPTESYVIREPGDPAIEDDWRAGDNGAPDNVIHVAALAPHILGLTEDEAESLFDSGNNLADIEEIVAGLAGEQR